MQKKAFIVLAVLIALLGVIGAAGCVALNGGVQKDTYPSPGSAMYATESVAGSRSGAYQPVPTPAPTTVAYSPGSTAGTDQMIISSAYVDLEVKDVQGAMESLKTLAAGRGGYVSSSNMNRDSSDRFTGSVVMRVPAAAFEPTLDALKSIGTIRSSSTSGEDVTEEYVDLNARKTALQNQLDQYYKILAKADKVEDILKVQVQIERVQVDLDRIEGRLKYLNSRVDLSTITVNLEEPAPIGGGISHDFASVINEGIAGFLGVIDALIILVFMLLPLIILGGIGYGVYRWHKGRKSAPLPPVKTEQTEKK
jgi:hypothetical protein